MAKPLVRSLLQAFDPRDGFVRHWRRRAVTLAELSAAFEGDISEQKRFLDEAGISHSEAWTLADSEAAHRAWNLYVKARRGEKVPKRTVADFLIGGFASNRQGLVTRDPGDFQRWFPALAIRDPLADRSLRGP